MEHCQAFTITDDASTFLAQNISAIVSRDTKRNIFERNSYTRRHSLKELFYSSNTILFSFPKII
jgi:hypothetical protein